MNTGGVIAPSFLKNFQKLVATGCNYAFQLFHQEEFRADEEPVINFLLSGLVTTDTKCQVYSLSFTGLFIFYLSEEPYKKLISDCF